MGDCTYIVVCVSTSSPTDVTEFVQNKHNEEKKGKGREEAEGKQEDGRGRTAGEVMASVRYFLKAMTMIIFTIFIIIVIIISLIMIIIPLKLRDIRYWLFCYQSLQIDK